MSYQKLITTLILILSFTFSACKKDEEKMPTAKFDFDKSQYNDGETINLINHSDDAVRFRWTFPDGTTSGNADASYPTPKTGVAYTMNFKLEAYSESGMLSDYVVKSVGVTPAAGKAVVYAGLSGGYFIIYIDGVYKGEHEIPPTSTAPQCDQAGFPTFLLTPGTHNVEVAGWDNWSTSFAVVNGQCTKLLIGS